MFVKYMTFWQSSLPTETLKFWVVEQLASTLLTAAKILFQVKYRRQPPRHQEPRQRKHQPA